MTSDCKSGKAGEVVACNVAGPDILTEISNDATIRWRVMASDGQDGHDLFPIRLRDPEGLAQIPTAGRERIPLEYGYLARYDTHANVLMWSGLETNTGVRCPPPSPLPSLPMWTVLPVTVCRCTPSCNHLWSSFPVASHGKRLGWLAAWPDRPCVASNYPVFFFPPNANAEGAVS
ncbi:uncharacterized protein BO96DRAFT_433472 [Aspergillus niger CBS 101883]|uniref:uncharacterized protein n=1 Tax=Aspergillus lacticoffeatus (strain CBS 101883) TaxID=1450533 RepID=UPI000D7EFA63|nr:uncharacterized protein BO96DRAFT_433472 [Aspergillus niger CBS 101883]PYH57299.1 hypothetical protein BO96DRAFT_433472 [Aspergillus niger CBS 101883]